MNYDDVPVLDHIVSPVTTNEPGATSYSENLKSRPPEKTARDIARDQIRQARQYRRQIEHTTTDIVRKPIVTGTNKFYTTVLREWDLFIAEYQGSKDPTDLKTAKDFVLYFTQGRRGRNERGGRLTVTYTYTVWKCFMAAWSRQHHISFTKSHQDTILNFIKGGEAGSPSLSRKMRAKRNFTRDDFLACILQLWQNDWHDFDHERYRVGLHLLLLLHCNTSARRAEYEREWTYADINVSVVWLDQATQPQVVIDFQRNKAKGLQDWESEQPQHMLYELVNLPFYCNSVLFFMAAVLADDALRDYHSWDEICTISKPEQQKHVTLHWHPEKTDWPVFPRSSRQGQLDHTRTSASLTSQALVDLGHRAGFQDNVVLHAARREVLLQVDNYGYSCNERMRFAAHVNSDTYRRSYQTAMPMVDGQASYFQFTANSTELHDLRRSYSWRRNPFYRPTLKEALRYATLENETCRGTDSDSKNAHSQKREANPTKFKERQKEYDQRRHQRDLSLREQNQQAEPPESSAQVHESSFKQTRKLMPERDRLADTLFQEGSLRDSVGREVMQDLITLCGTQVQKTYCTTLNTSGKICDTCRRVNVSGKENTWWSHVYRCRKRLQTSTRGFAEFCFLCFQWYNDCNEWTKHAEMHVNEAPLQCSMAIFRHNVIRPGLCPSCLGRGEYSQHLNPTNWKQHIREHILQSKSTVCLHPRCRQLPAMTSRGSFLDHLADIHDIHLDKATRLEALKASDTSEPAHKPGALSFIHIDADDFAMLDLHGDVLNFKGQRSQHQRVDRTWPINDDVIDQIEEADQAVEVDMTTSQNSFGTTQLQIGVVRGDSGCHAKDTANRTAVDTLPSKLNNAEREKVCGIAEHVSAVDRLPCSASKRIAQAAPCKETNVTINVPPLPDSWRNISLMGIAHQNVEGLSGLATPHSNIHIRSRRGRPRGSRNRATLRREKRLAKLHKMTSR